MCLIRERSEDSIKLSELSISSLNLLLHLCECKYPHLIHLHKEAVCGTSNYCTRSIGRINSKLITPTTNSVFWIPRFSCRPLDVTTVGRKEHIHLGLISFSVCAPACHYLPPLLRCFLVC